MQNLTFTSLRGTRTAIHCSTKSEAEQVEKICGFEKCAKAWLIYKKTYCISLSKDAVICKGMFSEIDWYAKNGYTIIPAADFIAANSGVVETPKSEARHYEISFGNHLQCLIEVTNNEIKVTDAVNGWGDNVPLAEIKITAIGQIKAEARRIGG